MRKELIIFFGCLCFSVHSQTFNQLANRADSLTKSSKFRESNNIYLSLIEENPDYDYLDIIYQRIGRNYVDLDVMDSALISFDRSIDFNPKSSNSLYYRGHVFIHFKEFQKALDDFKNSFEIKPNIHTVYNIGLCFNKLELYDSSIHYALKTLEFSDSDLPAYYLLLQNFMDANQWDKAIEVCDDLIKLEPYSGYLNRAKILGTNLNQFSKAQKDLAKCITLMPSRGDAYWYSGKFFIENTDYSEAVEMFDKLIELEPENPYAYEQRATAWFNVGILNYVCRDLDKAIQYLHSDSNAILEWKNQVCK